MSSTSSSSLELTTYWAFLKSHNRVGQEKAAHDLREYVETQKREMEPQKWTRFCMDCYQKVFDLISSNKTQDRIGGILLMDQLIGVQTGENELKIGKFCNYLKMIIRQATSSTSIVSIPTNTPFHHLMISSSNAPTATSMFHTQSSHFAAKNNKSLALLELATQVLGHLTKAAGPLSTEMVEDLINNYIVELLSAKQDTKRLAAVWIIKELTLNVPTLLNIHLNKVIQDLQHIICDQKVNVRLGAVEALRECLSLIVRRPQAYRQQFEKIYSKAVSDLGVGPAPSTNSQSPYDARNNQSNPQHHKPSNAQPDIRYIHGSLLTFGELLKGGEYMKGKFKAICQYTLLNMLHPDRFIRNAVIELLPKLAEYDATLFVQYGHLKQAVDYLTGILQSNGHNAKDLCYLSLGLLSEAVGKKICPYLVEIVGLLKEGLLGFNPQSSVKVSVFHSALACVSNLVCAVGSDLKDPLKPLIEQMFAGGLSNDLVETLKNICKHIEALQQPIHEQLALEIWSILSASSETEQPLFDLINDMNNKTYRFGHDKGHKTDYGMANWRTSSTANGHTTTMGGDMEDEDEEEANDPMAISQRMRSMTTSRERMVNKQSIGTDSARNRAKSRVGSLVNKKGREEVDHRLIHLALCALADFELDDVFLLPFIREIASIYLNFDAILVRKQASLTCSTLLSRLLLSSQLKRESHHNASSVSMADSPRSKKRRKRKRANNIHIEWEYRMKSMVVGDVLERLLSVAITDPHSDIRAELLSSFGEEFDHYLSKNDSLETLFIALNDEVFMVQRVVLTILGRLAKRNPGQVMPNLRQTLIQLLTQLQFSRDVQVKCNSAQLLGTFIDSVQSLVRPYVGAISGVLLPKLEESEDIGLQTQLLSSIGKLSKIAGLSMEPYLKQLLPIILKFLSDKFSQKRREVALISLSQLIQNTLFVVEPYNEYKSLLSTILSSLESTQSWSIRKEAMRTLGILGALDPFQHKVNERELTSNAIDHHDRGGGSREDSLQLLQLSMLRNDQTNYYPAIALNALVLMLDDGGLSKYHSEVLRVIISILYRLQSAKSKEFLPLIVPSFLKNMNRTKEDSLRRQFIQHLSSLISIAQLHIKPFLDGIFEQIHFYWSDPRYSELYEDDLLKLINCVSVALGDEFKVYLTDLIPLLLNVLHTDKEEKRGRTLKVLRALQSFGSNLEDHLFLVIPPLMKLCEQQDLNVRVRRECIKSITHLCRSVNFSAYSSRVIHPLIRIIDEPLDPELRNQASLALCALLVQMGSDYAIFIPTIDKILKKHKFTNEAYKNLVDKLIRNDMRIDYIIHSMDQEYRHHSASHGMDKGNTSSNANGGGGGGGKWPRWPLRSARAGTDVSSPANSGSGNKGVVNSGGDDQFIGMDGHHLSDHHDGMDHDDDSKERDERITLQPSALAKVVQQWNPEAAYTKDDWVEWLKTLQVELLKQSPNPALRLCAPLAQKHPPLSAQLFSGGFLSCWSELQDFLQDELIRSVSTAFDGALRNPGSVPNEVLLTLLQLTEFMDRQGEALPVMEQKLGAVAEMSHSYAKALYSKEKEFGLDAKRTIAPLMTIYNRLQQQEAAEGIVVFAQSRQSVRVQAEWFEKLNKWTDALDAYERSQLEEPTNVDLKMGRMRCLKSLGNWHRLHRLAKHAWKHDGVSSSAASAALSGHDMDESKSNGPRFDFDRKQEIASLGAVASWHLFKWRDMKGFVEEMDKNQADGSFYRAILQVHAGNYEEGMEYIDKTREALDTELTALVGESYSRAYSLCVRAQQLVELEEILKMKKSRKQNRGHVDYRAEEQLYKMWDRRLSGCEQSVNVWQDILSVRSLIRPPSRDTATYLKFSSLCRKNDRLSLSLDVLTKLIPHSPDALKPAQLLHHVECGRFDMIFDSKMMPRDDPNNARIAVSVAKHCWAAGRRPEAIECLRYVLDHKLTEIDEKDEVFCEIKCDSLIKLGQWIQESADDGAKGGDAIRDAIGCFEEATRFKGDSYWAWHELAVMHYLAINDKQQRQSERESQPQSALQKAKKKKNKKRANGSMKGIMSLPEDEEADDEEDENGMVGRTPLDRHIVDSVNAFFRSIAIYNGSLSQHDGGGVAAATKLQDILRLLHLWFNYGQKDFVGQALLSGFDAVSVDTWLDVIPQIIARLQTAQKDIAALIQKLLIKVGRAHPQALVYALAVAQSAEKEDERGQKSKANNQSEKPRKREDVVQVVLDRMREHSPRLVEQALLVRRELIRCAILWDEMWYEALEEASRTYFGNKDCNAMLAQLEPLHEQMLQPCTFNEVSFEQNYGRDLAEAYEWCLRYKATQRESDLNQCWEFYAAVFRNINKKLTTLQYLELQYVSPELEAAKHLQLAVPGTYSAGAGRGREDTVSIERFVATLKVMESKQRPRKLAMMGSNGVEYTFLLKGHEDLRLDERVMQLFDLVNTLLSTHPETRKRDLFVRGYAIIPLSATVGILEWVPNCDTIHALIKDYRESSKIVVNIENRLMLQMAPDFAALPSIQKVEVFEHALRSTTGQDLAKMLWLKSADAEMWLEKRTEYTRSLAVMSMVGYILGLGDRHPSNFMLDRFTGKLIHIDFGDCFEVAMQRDKFPEKFPFRLTRMLVQAMEISGIEGNFRITSQWVMRLIRDNKESIQAVLEAFAYDPLINWRLGIADNEDDAKEANAVIDDPQHQHRASQNFEDKAIVGTISSKTFISQFVGAGSNGSNVEFNEKAVDVLKRISQKLKGRDFWDIDRREYTVNEQVHKLILQATSHENLAQAYLGWCPLW